MNYNTFDIINNPLKSNIIDKCKLNEELSNYIKNDHVNITKWNLVDIIISSPEISLEEKRDIFKYLSESGYDKIKKHANQFDYETSFGHCNCKLSYAIDKLKNIQDNEILIVNIMVYDIENHDISIWDTYPAKSYNIAEKYISNNLQYLGNNNNWWFEINKWVYDNNRSNLLYTYIYIMDKLVYVDIQDRNDDSFQGFRNYISNPIPFRSGDIVDVDTTPFGEKQQVLLIEVDNSDRCGIQCLYKNKYGLYEIGDLRLGCCLKEFSYIPPTIRLQKTNSQKIDNIFITLSKFIKDCHIYGIDIKSTFFNIPYGSIEEDLLNCINIIKLPEKD